MFIGRINDWGLLVLVLLSSTSFAGITRTVCKSSVRDLKICVEEPNARLFIPLKDAGVRYQLEELDPYVTYADKNFSLDFEKMEVTDLANQEVYRLECGQARPGICGNF